MNIEVISVGKLKSGFIGEGVEQYVKRIKHYVSFLLTELPDVKTNSKISEKDQKEAEGKNILSKISSSDLVVLLDERGKEYTSRQFAESLESMMLSGKKKLIFVIGGPFGFSDKVYERADKLLALSKMTFTHEMVRLFFCEQLYRAFTIRKGEPYHHD